MSTTSATSIEPVVSLTEHYSKKYDKHIYIFGERHGKKALCATREINIVDFLEQTIREFKSHDVPIDLCLEAPHITKEEAKEGKFYTGESAIYDILDRFRHCSYGFNKKCSYANKMRLHNIDIRQLADPKSNVFRLEHIYNTYNKLAEDMTREKEIDLHDEILTTTKLIFLPEEIKKKDDLVSPALIMLGSKIPKQLAAITDKETLGFINVYLQARIAQVGLTYGDIATFYNGLNEELRLLEKNADNSEMRKLIDNGVLGAIHNVKDKIGKYLIYMMDYYLLGRLFRVFQLNNSQSMHKIIIYVGDLHAQTYREVLNLLGFELIQSAYAANSVVHQSQIGVKKQKSISCLDISIFKQPFFQPVMLQG